MIADESTIVGIDVGGANLKYADIDRRCHARVFALWRQPDRLAEVIADDLKQFAGDRSIDALAITMTGELADCFVDRAQGVQHIIEHVQQAAASAKIPNVRFYGVDGEFHDADDAVEHAEKIAAANWHALARFVAAEICDDGLLIDIGSTTTDIIPLVGGDVAAMAGTDYDRLVQHSLVYVGCRRTPACALVEQLRFQGESCPVMNEVFATIDDARILLGHALEDASDRDTADGMPRTREFAANRIARMIGRDRRNVSIDDAESLARQIVTAARDRITDGIHRNNCGGRIVITGHGEDLIAESFKTDAVRLSESLGPEASRCAPSVAVAKLLLAQVTGARG